MKYLTIIVFLILVSLSCGPKGDQGPAGPPGAGCSVTTVLPNATAPNGGALVACGATQTVILNGSPGVPGTSLDFQPFCPDKVGYYAGSYGPFGLQEYYIRSGVHVYAILDSGSATGVYLTLINYGNYNYRTSDGSNCSFTVNTNGTVTEH